MNGRARMGVHEHCLALQHLGGGKGWCGGNSHLSILTATFMVDCEWLRPWAVASTTRPKAPEPRVRPARNSEVTKLALVVEER